MFRPDFLASSAHRFMGSIWCGTCLLTVLLASLAIAEPPLTDGQELRTLEEVSREIVEQTNEFRREHDLQAVEVSDELQSAAKYFAKFMAESGKYGHRADGNSPAQRAKAKGYDYCVVRENIAYRTNSGDPTREKLVDIFVQGWIDSPEHRENMLASYVTQTGVAVATDDGVTFYAVQMFGRPKDKSITLKIANTSEVAVTLIVESNGSVDDIVLQPRMQLRMTRCFPTTLSLKSSEKTIEVKESTEFVINPEGLQKGEVPRAISPTAR